MYAVYWLIASAVFLLVEIMTLGLTSIWFAGGAVVAAITALFGVPFWVQMLIFIVVTCLLFALTRPVAKRYLNSKVQKTNTDALIGQTALVKETINNMESKGLVQLNGQDWTARSFEAGEIIPEGSEDGRKRNPRRETDRRKRGIRLCRLFYLLSLSHCLR